MVLVDTCGWIEWLVDGPIAEKFAPYLADPTQVPVPAIVQYELYKWVCRERDEAAAMEVIGVTEQGRVIAFDTPLALAAAEQSLAHDLAMADAIVYTTALQAGVQLVTSDSHFTNLPGALYFSKT